MKPGALLFILFFVLLGIVSAFTVPYSKVGYALYPDWAHSHWVWLPSGADNATSCKAMVEGYLSRNISVGAVDLDSEWSTGVNNFIFNRKKFPDPAGFIKDLHNQNIRVILWVTSMVDTDSSNYQEGLKNNYFLNNGTTVKWWHGRGSFIDYTNVQAMEWWHKQMDVVLSMGIDGWKTDGTGIANNEQDLVEDSDKRRGRDPFVFELFGARGQGGDITEREYADAYYRDFFYYTRTFNPNSLIMSRPVDSYPPLYWSFSPHDVMFSGWVGDQDPTFDGLKDAVRNCFESAWRGYLNFGSDIGGYRYGDRTQHLFLRWAQWSTFMPLMENGGDQNHFPWQFDKPGSNLTVDTYRTFVNAHLSLKSYFLTAGSMQYEIGQSVITPLTEEVIIPYIHGWDYLLWRDIYVATIVEDSLQRKVEFPSGNNWINFFDPSKIYQGGTSPTLTFQLNQYPAYRKQGSLIALHINDHNSPYASFASNGFVENHLTAVVYPLKGMNSSRIIRRWNKRSTEMSYEWNEKSNKITFISTPSIDEPVILLLEGIKSHSEVEIFSRVHAQTLAYSQKSFQNVKNTKYSEARIGASYYFNEANNFLLVHTGYESLNSGVYLDIQIKV